MSRSAVRLWLCVALCCGFAGRALADDADDQFSAAAGQYADKHWDAAAQQFRAFVRAYPDNAKHTKAMFFEGESLSQLGRHQEAYKLFVDLLAEQPTGPYAKQSLFRAAEAAVRSNMANEADIRLTQFATQYPNDKLNANILLYRGELALRNGDAGQAERWYRESLNHFANMPTDVECRFGLAQALESQKRIADADQLLAEVAATDRSPWAEMALLKLAAKQMAASKPQGALETYLSIEKRFPNSELLNDAHLGCGKALVQLGRYADAASVLAPLTNDKEFGSEARTLLSQSQKAIKQTQAAEAQRKAAEALSQAKAQEKLERAEKERVAQEKAAQQKEKAAQDKQDKIAREKLAQEKATEEKLAQDKATQENAAQEKAAQEKARQDRINQEVAGAGSSRRDNKSDKTVVAAPVDPGVRNDSNEFDTSDSSIGKSLQQPTVAKIAAGRPTSPPVAANQIVPPSPTVAGTPTIAANPTAAAKVADTAAAKSGGESLQQPESQEAVAQRTEQSRRRSAAIRFQAADAMIRAGEYNRAIATLQMGDNSGDDPRSLSNRYLMAVALHAVQRDDEAEKTLDELNTSLTVKLSARSTAPTASGDSTSTGSTAHDDLAELQTLHDKVQLAQASTLVTHKKYAEAIEPLKAFLASPSKDVGEDRALAYLAICLAHTNRVEEAEQVLDNLRANYPHSKAVLPATDQVAEASYSAGHYAVAAGLFGSMTADENPPEMVSRALVKLGWCRYETGENEAAEQAFGAFLAKFQSDKQAPEVTLVRGQALEHAGKDKEAIATYRQGMSRYPQAKEMPLIIAACAEVYDRLQQDDDAVPLYQRVVREYPNSPDIDAVLYNLAWSLRDLGRGNDSDKIFRKLFEEQPNSRFWPDSAYRLAERASQRGDREAANAYLEPLVNGDCPGAVKQYAIYLQAQIAIGEEKWTLAQVPLERLQHEFPESPLCLAAEFWRAEAAYRSGDTDTATERFNALAPKVTKDSEAWMAIIPLRQAQLLAQQKRWAEARVIAEKITQDFPKFDRQYEADFLIGRAMAADADLEHSRAMFDKVVHSTAGSKTETAAMAQWMIGETYFQQENYASALREFGKVELRFSAYPRWQASALLQEAKCNDQLGHAKDAADIYARLLQSFPQTEFVAEATKGLTETSRK